MIFHEFLTQTTSRIASHLVKSKTFSPCYITFIYIDSVREKTNNLGSNQVQHKPGCAVTEDGYRLEILDLESRGIVLSL